MFYVRKQLPLKQTIIKQKKTSKLNYNVKILKKKRCNHS